MSTLKSPSYAELKRRLEVAESALKTIREDRGAASAISGSREALVDLDEAEADETGRIVRLAGSLQDLTKEKELVRKIENQQHRLESLMQAIPAPVFFKNADGRYLGCNPAFETLTGCTAPQITGKTVHEVWPEKYSAIYRDKDRELLETGGTQQYEASLVNAQGEERDVVFHKSAWQDPSGKISGLVGVILDITERRQTEEAFVRQLRFEKAVARISKRLLSAETSESVVADVLRHLLEASRVSRIYIFENFEDPVDGLCMKQTFEACAPGVAPEIDNPLLQHVVYAQGFGRWREALSGGNAIRGHVSDFPDDERDILESQAILSLLVLPLVVDGKWWGFVGFDETRRAHDWQDSEVALLGTAGEMLGAYFTRRKVEENLHAEREQLLSIFNSIDEVIYISDPTTHEMLYMNRFLQEQQPMEYRGAKCYKILQNRDAPCPFCTNDIILKQKPKAHHWEFHNKNFDRHYAIADRIIRWPDGRDVRFEMAIDVTDHKRAEAERENLQAQLRQAQKMEAVGRLAGGVAHDFNNMLGIIIGHADMILEEMDPDQPFYADLTEIRKAGARSVDLTRQLLAFARKQTVAPRVIDLNRTVEGMLKMLQRLIGEDIEMAWIPDEKIWPVKIDPGQVDQILANLCVNARDSIADVGKVTIETGNCVFDEDYVRGHAGAEPGEYAMLAVSDNGCGMDAETLSHVFEPFFTTKEMGKGTGLGLATVYGVVKQNKGLINVYSEPGRGTTFKIYLPRHMAKTTRFPEKGTSRPGKRGRETVLLVEDEPAILKMTTRMLEREGYTVMGAGTPGEAVRLATEHAGDIHLLMTDVVMPEMNGRDLAKNILSLYPRLKCLFMSGYTANVIAHHGVLDEGVNFIQKPFSKGDLAVKVREILDNPSEEKKGY